MLSEEAIAIMQIKHRRKRLLIRLGLFIAVLILIPIVYIIVNAIRYYPKIKSGELTSYDQVRISRALSNQAGSEAGNLSADDVAQLVPTSTVPEFGNENALLTVVEFIDYQCTYSKDVMMPIRNIIEQSPYKDQVHVVIRDYPITEIHPDARNSAHAAKCVLEQGQEAYRRFQALMFGDQSGLSLEGLRTKANLARINVARYEECMNERRYDLEIDRDIEFAKRIGVEGTPTFFVNGIMVPGAMTEDEFKVLIDSALSQLIR